MSHRLTTVFANKDAPVAVVGIVASAVSGLLAAGLCSLVDTRVLPLGLVIGAILGFIATSAPMFMALRLIAVTGLLLTGAAVLGVGVRESAILAALVMAALAFVTAVWTAVPLVGGVFSSLPPTVFILLLGKGNEFAGGAPVLLVAAAGLLAMVPPAALTVALSIRDPRKYDRAMTAALWKSDTSSATRGIYARVLLLNGAPPTLLYLAAHGSLGNICRSWLTRHQGDDSAAMAQADSNITAVTTALLPKGPLTPRTATLDTAAMDAAAGGATPDHPQTADSAWALWAASQRRASEVLGGARHERVVLRPILLILGSLVRCLVRPEVAVFRYGIQRAVALGAGAFALVQSDGNQNVFWVLLTMAAVLQANAPSTVVKVAQRSVGTFAGVLLAVALSFVLPPKLLVPWIAGVAIVVGFAWAKRNYAVTAMLTGFAVVLFFGAPTDAVGRYATMRAVDVLIGGVLAASVARFVMPVRPRLPARRQYLVDALRGLEQALRQRLADPTAVPVSTLAARQAEVSRAVSDLHTDLSLTGDKDVVQAYSDDLDGFINDDAALFVLGMTMVDVTTQEKVDDLPVDSALDWLRDDIDTRAATTPTAAATAPAGG